MVERAPRPTSDVAKTATQPPVHSDEGSQMSKLQKEARRWIRGGFAIYGSVSLLAVWLAPEGERAVVLVGVGIPLAVWLLGIGYSFRAHAALVKYASGEATGIVDTLLKARARRKACGYLHLAENEAPELAEKIREIRKALESEGRERSDNSQGEDA